MGEKATDWYFGQPGMVIMLIAALISTIYFGGRYLKRREEFWCDIVEKKDKVIGEMMSKMMDLHQAAIETEVTLIREIKDMHDEMRKK